LNKTKHDKQEKGFRDLNVCQFAESTFFELHLALAECIEVLLSLSAGETNHILFHSFQLIRVAVLGSSECLSV
jgi:hypothetical protein